MSDDPHRSANDVEKRIARWTKRNSCPFCDTQEWFVLSNDSGGEPIVGAVLTTNVLAGNVPAYTLFCGNCGFVRQHVVPIVDGDVRLGGSS
jgi:transcription elongation factor Elf1